MTTQTDITKMVRNTEPITTTKHEYETPSFNSYITSFVCTMFTQYLPTIYM